MDNTLTIWIDTAGFTIVRCDDRPPDPSWTDPRLAIRDLVPELRTSDGYLDWFAARDPSRQLTIKNRLRFRQRPVKKSSRLIY